MVHALKEARRVLEPDGILIDLRPANRQCRVGVLTGEHFHAVGETCESQDDGRAADRALEGVLARGLFRPIRDEGIECDVVCTSGHALRDFLDDYTDLGDLPAHGRLIERARAACRRSRGKGRLAARITLTMRIMGAGSGT